MANNSCLRLKPNFKFVVLSGQGVLLLEERRYKVLYGEIYERLIPMLDGSRSSDEIVSELSPCFSASKVYSSFLTLQARGYCIQANQFDPSR